MARITQYYLVYADKMPIFYQSIDFNKNNTMEYVTRFTLDDKDVVYT